MQIGSSEFELFSHRPRPNPSEHFQCTPEPIVAIRKKVGRRS